MSELLALILAILSAMGGAMETSMPNRSDDWVAVAERPQLELRPLHAITIDPGDPVPDGVDPASQPATIDADGTITHADGTTDCVTASPCDFARAGYQPGEPAPGDIDPVWNSPELQGQP